MASIFFGKGKVAWLIAQVVKGFLQVNGNRVVDTYTNILLAQMLLQCLSM